MNARTISFLFISFFILLFGNTAGAQSPSAEQTALENALLWKIEGKGLDTASYLFGTIHIIPEQDYLFGDTATRAFNACKQVAFEIDLEEMMDLGNQLGLMMQAIMPDGTTLKDLLTEEDYKLVNQHFNEMGMPLFVLERIKPMFLSVFASGEGGPGMMSDGGMVSYEMDLMEKANRLNMDISGLETAEYQMSMFDSIPYKVQAEMLVESIKMSETGTGEIEAMVKIYKDRDINTMYEMLRADSEGIGAYERILIENRNRNWIPVIEELVGQAPTFIAVGAGHLGGPYGVVTLLREAGYKVSPVW